MKISFINLMADLCEKTDADIELVAKGMGMDDRIGDRFLRAGIGYGGSCFPKDVRALIRIGEDLGTDMSLLKDVDKINENRVDNILAKLKKALWILKGKTIAVLGLAFKPETDDLRNAPSIRIIKELRREGAFLKLYDPQAAGNMKEVFPEKAPEFVYAPTAYAAFEDANAALIVTEWSDFRKLDLIRVKKLMANPILIDGRNVLSADDARTHGFDYYGVGRQHS
jgi:UDPglucose 6-dehydrogenase